MQLIKMKLIKKHRTLSSFLDGFLVYMLVAGVNYLIIRPNRPFLLWTHIMFAILNGILFSILIYFLDKWKKSKILLIKKYSPSFLLGFFGYMTASWVNYLTVHPDRPYNRPYLLWFHILWAILTGVLMSVVFYFQEKRKKRISNI